MKKILILVDYRNQFWLKSDYKEANFNIPLLKSEFEKLGYHTEIKQFSTIDLKSTDYNGNYVIYQSTEDPNSFYKSFIEDCLLALELKGAILIPDFKYFRAHNNKVFMEMLRDVNNEPALKNPLAKYYGTYEEYLKYLCYNKSIGPKVFKLSEGAQSKNVFLLRSINNFRKIPKKKTSTFNFYYWLVDQIKPYFKSNYPNYRKKSHHRQKFIIQDFVPNLQGDFKVLVYANDYYILSRKIRKNDFRASGSGILSFTKAIPNGILEYAKECFEAFDVPFMGLDIAEKEGKFYLIEFQFVHFGNYTLEKSPFHFHYEKNGWKTIDMRVVLEEKFADSIHQFIQKKFENPVHP